VRRKEEWGLEDLTTGINFLQKSIHLSIIILYSLYNTVEGINTKDKPARNKRRYLT
jgi:hypothetical protein